MKAKIKGKAISGIAMATILLATVFIAMVLMGSAVSKGDNFNYIGKTGGVQSVLIGQNIQFNSTEIANAFAGKPVVYRYVSGDLEDIWPADNNWRIYNVNWPTTGAYYVSDNASDKKGQAQISVKDPKMPLKLKVTTSGKTKEVSSIAVGSPGFKIDVGGINLFDNDQVDLVIMGPTGQIKNDEKNNQKFTDITVSYLKEVYEDEIITIGWDIGVYTFQIKTDAEYACGLEAESNLKELKLLKGEIAIEADTTDTVELRTVTLTVTGVAADNIKVEATPCENASFKGGIDDTPSGAGCSFNDTIDGDSIRKYAIEFTDTGTFTVRVTVTGPGTTATNPRINEYDTVDITVSKKGVDFDVPSTAIIGDRLNIKGTANTGTYVSVYVDDTLYPPLRKLVVDDGEFEKEITTTEIGMTVPGSVRLKAWIDIDNAAYADPPSTTPDGSATILMLETHLDAIISQTAVSHGDSFEVYGNASSDYAEIVAICPEGGNGTGIDGLYGTTIVTVPTFCNYTNYNYYKKLKVDGAAENGTYTIIVLIPGIDGVYGDSGYSYIDNILDLDGKGPELGAIDVSNKTQAEIVAIIRDIINVTSSDDFMRIENIVVTQFDALDTCGGGYPSISGTHNGTITIERMYTYSCPGTGGHSEHAAFYDQNGTLIREGHWNGYQSGDYQYITFNAPFTLEIGETYNYTIETGSYPQIIHEHSKEVAGGVITCTEFIDANGKRYNNRIPAIGLE